jgi:hypothetical protein
LTISPDPFECDRLPSIAMLIFKGLLGLIHYLSWRFFQLADSGSSTGRMEKS